jgi:transcriptional regulator with XRE-family HTH domain
LVSERDPRDWAGVGKAIAARRKAQDLTQVELHVATRVSVTVISELEKGIIRSRRPGTLERLSGALGWPAYRLDHILNWHLTRVPVTPESAAPGLAVPEHSVVGLTSAEKAFLSFGEKLDKLNGKLDALLKHYDIAWQPGESSGTSVDLAGYDHAHGPPQPEDGAPAPTADD